MRNTQRPDGAVFVSWSASLVELALVLGNAAFVVTGATQLRHLHSLFFFPMPTGLWTVLPGLGFAALYLAHLLENAPRFEIIRDGDEIKVRWRERTRRRWREATFSAERAESQRLPHFSAGWGAVGVVQTIYGFQCARDGAALLAAGISKQGALLATYGAFLLPSLLLAWFLPHWELRAGTFAVVLPRPSVGELTGRYSFGEVAASFPRVKIERGNVRGGGAWTPALVSWLAFALATTTDAFHYQFVVEGTFLAAALATRRLVVHREGRHVGDASPPRVHPAEAALWAHVLNEVAMKVAYLAALVAADPIFLQFVPVTVAPAAAIALAFVARARKAWKASDWGRRATLVFLLVLATTTAWNYCATAGLVPPTYAGVLGFLPPGTVIPS
ncbi:MAG: hypothetical protein Kow0069_11620 [Promethearchaeota archaeon]